MIRIAGRAGARRRAGIALAASVACTRAFAADGSMPAASGWIALVLVATVAAGFIVLLQRQRRLAEALRTARIEALGLADQLDVWLWRSGPDHRMAQLRPPQGTATAAWPAPQAGTPLWEQFRSTDLPALRACVEAHAPITDVSVSFAAADGVLAACRMRGRALTDAQGRFAGYIGTLRVLEAESSGAVVAATSAATAVEGPFSEPAAPDNERESFSYTVSHDLRAPIRVVEGFARILKEDYGRFLDRIGNDHLERVLAAAARMNSMIDALLALSRLQQQPLSRKPVDLSQLATYIIEDLKREHPERVADVRIEPGMMVHGDPTLLRIALENLLGNAWKYSSQCALAKIEFRHDTHQGQRVMMVGDNGAGFDMRFADRLFGVFQRLHSAKDFHGTGVGLASVRRIVRRHGGDIWAEAEVGKGARFYFTLS